MLEHRDHRQKRPDHARVIPAGFLGVGGIPDQEVHAVRSGIAVWAQEWEALYSEGRVRTLAHAVFARMRDEEAAASHATAAAVHRLPLYRVRADRIDVICPGANTRHDSSDVVRHHMPLPADGHAQLPGESIVRLWMLLLGVPTPVLQYRVEDEMDRLAFLDFAFPQLGRWLEFDGRAKYADPYLLGGRTAEDVLAEQKDRERWVQRVTGWRVDRCGFAEMPNIETFARFLRSIALLP